MELQLEEWMIEPEWEPPEDRVNLVKLPSTIADVKQFEEIIDYAMKVWQEEQVRGMGASVQVKQEQAD